MEDKEKLNEIRAIVGGHIRVRCRATECSNFDGSNGCKRDEVVIGSNGSCNCYYRGV